MNDASWCTVYVDWVSSSWRLSEGRQFGVHFLVPSSAGTPPALQWWPLNACWLDFAWVWLWGKWQERQGCLLWHQSARSTKVLVFLNLICKHKRLMNFPRPKWIITEQKFIVEDYEWRHWTVRYAEKNVKISLQGGKEKEAFLRTKTNTPFL